MNKQKLLEDCIAAEHAAIDRAKKLFEQGKWDEDLTAAVITDASKMIERNSERLADLIAYKGRMSK